MSIGIQDLVNYVTNSEFTSEQEGPLKHAADNCRQLLGELEKIVQKYSEFDPSPDNLKKRTSRTWRQMKLEPGDVRNLQDQIVSNSALINVFLESIGRYIIPRTMASLGIANQLLNRANQSSTATKQAVERKEVILDWLTPINYAPQQYDFLRRYVAGSGRWFLESEEYRLWVERSGQTLFCPGIAGAGKTILASIIIHDLMTRFSDDKEVGIAYFYLSYRRQEEQRVQDLFANLLKQLGQRQSILQAEITELYENHRQKRTFPPIVEIIAATRSILAHYSRVFVVVDAFDECQQPDGEYFLSTVSKLQQDSGLNLLVTSRFNAAIAARFKDCVKLEIRAKDEDVERYLNSRITRLPRFVLQNPRLQDEIKAEIIHGVEGM